MKLILASNINYFRSQQLMNPYKMIQTMLKLFQIKEKNKKYDDGGDGYGDDGDEVDQHDEFYDHDHDSQYDVGGAI